MRKYFFLILGLLPLVVKAQPVERIFVVTDRSVYIAGDEVGCSLFVFDTKTGKHSDYSAISYLELVSTEGTVETVKIGLMNGRGAGNFRIPVTVPTGNYRLLAYTALNANEEGNAWMLGAKTLSVFNTTSTARIPGGVTLEEETDYLAHKSNKQPSQGHLSFTTSNRVVSGEAFTLNIYNGGKKADVAVSIYAQDAILPPQNPSMSVFLDKVKESVPEGNIGKNTRPLRLPEYEGEIVYAAVEGLAGKQLDSLSGIAVATLSSAGSPTDVYVGKVGDKGRLVFFTNNIYGNRELVCELKAESGYISLVDPFLHPAVSEVEPLLLSRAIYSDIIRRKAALNNFLQTDTLVTFLPRRQDFLLEDLKHTRYHLNDYKRFPSFQEVIVEITRELRIRTVHGHHELQIIAADAVNSKKVAYDNILVMLDGVVISDLSLLENMDAMLLEDIDIYAQTIALGSLSYNGVVNFITRKNYVKALQFSSNVRVIDFQGASYPVAYLGQPAQGLDYRQLLYWHPLLTLEESTSYKISLVAPAYSGTFRAVAEGWDDTGAPVHEEYTFEVR